jgi:hypothetical protein
MIPSAVARAIARAMARIISRAIEAKSFLAITAFHLKE